VPGPGSNARAGADDPGSGGRARKGCAVEMLRRILIAAVFVALPAGMLYPLWRSPVSAGEDDLVYYYPLRALAAEQVRAGELPLWSASEAGGVALLGDPQSGLMFPTTALFWVLPATVAYSLSIFLTFSVAGGGAYLYLRRMGLVAPAAALGAVVFMFSGFMVAHRVHLAMIQAAALLGWGLWAIERVRSGAVGAATAMLPVAALTVAAGHWPTAVHMAGIWGAYYLVRARPARRAVWVAAATGVGVAAVLAPQLLATISWLGGTVRAEVPYAVAGENSFFPLAAVLAVFPFIMGNRTPNFFGQPWWGPWHQCEMLGYVGLATLVLAGSAVRRLYRRADPQSGTGTFPVRLWTWMLIGGVVFALGYYLPTYRLVHAIPVLGSVRCPARMLLLVDFALAALAAAAVDALVRGNADGLVRTLRRSVTAYLPAAMVAALALLAGLAAVEGRWWRLADVLSTGLDGADPIGRMRAALNPLSPAVYVPAALAVVTAVTVRWFLAAPRRRGWALVGVVLVDLFFPARFVDVPTDRRRGRLPPASPAAAWLRANAGTEPFRVWGLSRSYHHRPAELLLPKTCAALGLETISYYGPLQPVSHAHLFGFRPWGENYEWAWLLRRNHLLSLFNVRYVLAADAEFRRVIESVRIPARPPAPPGPNVLGERWSLHRARWDGGVLRLRSDGVFSLARATQPVRLEGGAVYRIALDARAPEGAGNYLAAEYLPGGESPAPRQRNPARLRIDVERLGRRWRHFEWTFRAPTGAAAASWFQVFTPSERVIEVRNVSLRRSSWEVPVNLAGRLSAGEAVYVDRTPAGLVPLVAGDPPVHIYENRLALPRSFGVRDAVVLDDEEEVIETLRWRPESFDATRQVLMAGGGGDLPGRFVSENLHVLDGASWRRANGLGAVAKARPGAWGEQFPGRLPVTLGASVVAASKTASVCGLGLWALSAAWWTLRSARRGGSGRRRRRVAGGK